MEELPNGNPWGIELDVDLVTDGGSPAKMKPSQINDDIMISLLRIRLRTDLHSNKVYAVL